MKTVLIIIIGLVIGMLTHYTRPSHLESSLIHCLILGVSGATVGSFIIVALGIYGSSTISTFLGAIIGATIAESLIRKANDRQLH